MFEPPVNPKDLSHVDIPWELTPLKEQTEPNTKEKRTSFEAIIFSICWQAWYL